MSTAYATTELIEAGPAGVGDMPVRMRVILLSVAGLGLVLWTLLAVVAVLGQVALVQALLIALG